ncbi:MAG: crotonase/enoyl-CoA hydratase family protein [Sphingobium sp.]
MMMESGRFDPGMQGREQDGPADILVEDLAARPAQLGGQPTNLFDLGQIDVRWDASARTLWAFMTPETRPNYNPAMLRDIRGWQTETKKLFDAGALPLRYMVLGSRFPGIFNLGGDLELFAGCIERGDLEGLTRYGHACIDVVHRAWRNADMPVVSIALAQGDALGGGFEALLCFDVVIAERSARFGVPEMLFGLFPGMGAYSILSRKIGRRMTERMLLSGKVYTAQEMYDMGVVTVLADDGAGEQATRDYIAANSPHQPGHVGIFEAGRRVDPLDYAELSDIVENWAKTALKLDPRDLRLMRRLASAQTRLSS